MFKDDLYKLAQNYYPQFCKLSKPLLALGFEYYAHERIFPNRQSIFLCNDKDILSNFYRIINTKHINEHHDLSIGNQNSLIKWDSIGDDHICRQISIAYGLRYGCTVVTTYQGYQELSHFGYYGEKRKLEERYGLIQKYLRRFSIYSKHKITRELSAMSELACKLPQRPQGTMSVKNIENDLAKFLKKTQLKKISLDCISKDLDIVLSKREAETLVLRASGLSMKEAAKMLNISSRTIESYETNLKNKFLVSSKKELMELVIKYQIIEYIAPMLDIQE